MTGSTYTLPEQVARLIGTLPETSVEQSTSPQINLDWALHWGRRGFHVFPCDSHVGNPLIDRWHRMATTRTGEIAELWSRYPDADIACVPDRSNLFAFVVCGDEGKQSLHSLQQEFGKLNPVLTVSNQWQTEFLFFEGVAFSSRDMLGNGLHVLGTGRYLFLPPSLSRLAEELRAEHKERHHA